MSHAQTAGRIVGALPPPPGQRANFVNPSNENASIIALQAVCMTLITIFVAMRVSLRAFILRAFGWDDAFCILGWAFSMTFSALTLKTMTMGLGVHLWDIPAAQVSVFGKWLFVTVVISSPTWLFIKLAFFWSYKRVFQPSQTMRWLCWISAGVCVAFYVAQVFHDIFACIPVQKQWDSKLPGHCLPNGVAGSVTAIFNVITDLYIFLLPLPFLWSLQMKMAKKIRLSALFVLGALVNAASIVRLIFTYVVASDKDVTWKIYKYWIPITLEIDLGLICVCALVFPSFWKWVSPYLDKVSTQTSSILRIKRSSSTSQYSSREGVATVDEKQRFAHEPRHAMVPGGHRKVSDSISNSPRVEPMHMV